MLKRNLPPLLRERYPHIDFSFSEQATPFATATPPHEAVGALEIHDDGDEATLDVKRTFHTHINPYQDMPAIDREAWITRHVFEFLDALFEDRILMYRVIDPDSGNLSGGGCARFEAPIQSKSQVPGYEDWECFVWSKPL